jgi:methyl-accepting chemotaxis protein
VGADNQESSMGNPLVSSLSLIDTSGIVIITAILLLLVTGVVLTLFIRGRYRAIGHELERLGDTPGGFDGPVLSRIVRDALAAQRAGSDVNTQAIVDQTFQSQLRGLLVGERFVKAMTGLVIILGLVGTFYGLSTSIGRLTSLLSGKAPAGADVTASLTQGLTETLSGMSVAFSASLFGIVSAIVLTLLGVFLNIGDRRLELMVQIEHYVDNVLLAVARGQSESRIPGLVAPTAGASAAGSARLEGAVHGFSESVARLEGAVAGFEQALSTFSSTTRDFREFNHHLKDNIQRMSLSFGDLSDSLRQQATAISSTMRSRERS